MTLSEIIFNSPISPLSQLQSPNFGLFAFTFFLAGLGIALQDSQANTYVSSLGASAHRYLGLIHAMYGVGLLLGPLIATAIAGHTSNWRLFYLVMIALNAPNCIFVGWTFSDTMRLGKWYFFATKNDTSNANSSTFSSETGVEVVQSSEEKITTSR